MENIAEGMDDEGEEEEESQEEEADDMPGANAEKATD